MNRYSPDPTMQLLNDISAEKGQHIAEESARLTRKEWTKLSLGAVFSAAILTSAGFLMHTHLPATSTPSPTPASSHTP